MPYNKITHRKKETGDYVKRKAFLAAYAESGNISEAAKAAGTCRRTHYDWMSDPNYAADFKDAHEHACESLEREARRRAVSGVLEPVVYQGEFTYRKREAVNLETGEVTTVQDDEPLGILKFSDTLLIFLMKGAMPEKYKDRASVEHSGSVDLVSRLQAARDRLKNHAPTG